MLHLSELVARFVAFVRAGYPHGVPETDYIPLLALLRRRLSDEEVTAVASQLAAAGDLDIDSADIGAAITRITDELPSPDDLDRVQRRLAAIGWPVDPGSSHEHFPSSEPAWWIASDGQRCPQRWETTFIYYTNESLQAVIDEAGRLTKTYGEQGWEIVSCSVQRAQVAHGFAAYDKSGDLFFEWSIVCSLKRPLPPG
jgi:hypothetical protein